MLWSFKFNSIDLFFVLDLLFHIVVHLFLVGLSLLISVRLEHDRLTVNFSKVVSQHVKCLINIFWGDGWPDPGILDFDRNKFILILSVRVILEPVIQMIGVNAPGVVDVASILNADGLHLIKNDSFGCHQGHVVFFYQDIAICDGNILVFVEYFQILGHSYSQIFII